METVKQLTEARRAYLEDMKWLRETFGIIPEPEEYLIKNIAFSAIEALANQTRESMRQALKDFQNFHKAILYHVAWDMLETTKEAIKELATQEPELYEEKLKQWKRASWALTQDIYNQTSTMFKEAIRIVSRI